MKCEIDAYGDFLQALGSAATPEVGILLYRYLHSIDVVSYAIVLFQRGQCDSGGGWTGGDEGEGIPANARNTLHSCGV
jgi:hypothetical protein